MDVKLKLAIYTLFFLIATGTFFYHFAEGWGYIDSFYFTSITISTIGYGDLYPTTTTGKIFTSFFAFAGVSIAFYALAVIGADYFARREKHLIKELEEQKSGNGHLDILRADKHLMKMDDHVLDLLKRLDARIKK